MLSRTPSKNKGSSPEREREKEELKNLNSRLEKFTNHVHRLKEANKELEDRLKQALAHPSSSSYNPLYDEQIASLKKDLEDLRRKLATSQKHLAAKEEENDDLKGKLYHLKGQLKEAEAKEIANSGKIPELEKELAFQKSLRQQEKEQQQQQEKELQGELQSMRDSFKDSFYKELEKEKNLLKGVFDEERQRLLDAHSDLMDKLQAEIASLETENTNLRVENSAFQKELQTLKEKVGAIKKEEMALRNHLQKQKDEHEDAENRLKERLRCQEEENAKVREEMKRKNRRIEELTSANFNLDFEIQTFKNILAKQEDSLGIKQAKTITYTPLPSRAGAPQILSPSPTSSPSLSSPSPSSPSPVSFPGSFPFQPTVTGGKRKFESTENFTPNKMPRREGSSPLAEQGQQGESRFPFKFVTTKVGIVSIAEIDPEGHYICLTNETPVCLLRLISNIINILNLQYK